jgi:hypothetical protein
MAVLPQQSGVKPGSSREFHGLSAFGLIDVSQAFACDSNHPPKPPAPEKSGPAASPMLASEVPESADSVALVTHQKARRPESMFAWLLHCW